MNEHSASTIPPHGYVLGHSQREIARLKAQARLIDPITKRFFREARIEEGMRVLDVGSGAGDVALLAAELVGASGAVVGVDRVSVAIEEARKRATALSLKNVTFCVGDPADLVFSRPFDAVVGRYVLQFLQDPAAMLRQLATQVRPGGPVVFHELDWGGVGSFPPVPTFDRVCQWGAQTLRLHGTETRMGAKLYRTFVEAGLSPPGLSLEALLGGGPNSLDVLTLVAGIIETLLPEMERLRVAAAADVEIATLLERMRAEVEQCRSIVIGHYQIAAWSRMPL
jgi:ubiquinone/menaquinone biosynthesis C-methylase UbiE